MGPSAWGVTGSGAGPGAGLADVRAAYGAGGSAPRPSRPAGPGQSRATGRANARPGGPGRRAGGGRQWAGSWCVTPEFLKEEASGAAGSAGAAAAEGPALWEDARGVRATMQWRALVLGLLLLRLGLHGALWLVFGLGPSMGFYQRFPLSFSFQRLMGPDGPAPAAPGPEDRPVGPMGPSWLQPPRPGAEAGRRRAPRRPRPGVCGPAHWGYVLGGRGRGPDEYERRYSGAFPPQLRAQMRDLARGMFVFGYDNYMAHAFPQDELNPIDCRGRGPDRGDP